MGEELKQDPRAILCLLLQGSANANIGMLVEMRIGAFSSGKARRCMVSKAEKAALHADVHDHGAFGLVRLVSGLMIDARPLMNRQ